MAKKGLIVDDAAFMRTMLKEILTKSGYEIIGEAANGREALEMYKSAKPDFVIMDITMPEMDGIQALKGIRSIDSNAVVIMCSAIGQQAHVLEAIKSGAKDFIVKPFQPDRVLESIRKAVG
jgi:two-component system chemotaxis response regulator CheY